MPYARGYLRTRRRGDGATGARARMGMRPDAPSGSRRAGAWMGWRRSLGSRVWLGYVSGSLIEAPRASMVSCVVELEQRSTV